MPARAFVVPEGVPAEVEAGFDRLTAELGIADDFSDEVENAAADACADPQLPAADLTDIDFFAIDPPGATDIDQIMELSRDGDGYLVRYAIADVATFVVPGGPVDAEARRRGQTYYAPHRRFPLHPPVLSEGAGSLLAGQTRPALVWQIRLGADGEVTDVDLGRAMVRSRAQLTYADVQRSIDEQTADEQLMLLAEIGARRQEVERARGGVSLNLPAQEVEVVEGEWQLAYRATVPAEDWNAQISLLTGICAANLMLDAGVGILRTLPPASDGSLRRLRRIAGALGQDWPAEVGYAEFVRGIDATTPRGVAMMYACTTLFRGAGYTAFDGDAPEQPLHSALATPYTHATAPLRRLVDRYALECCVAIAGNTAVPDWVRAALPELPEQMAASDRKARRFESGIVGLVEALVLQPQIGQRFRGTVVEVDDEKPDRGSLLLAEPAVEAAVTGQNLRAGDEIEAVLRAADPETGEVIFEAVR